jgi:hypothetical protein
LIAREGLQAQHVKVMPAAAGGPKGLILGPIDRFVFGQWLPQSMQPVHLVGASIGAWRMATACLDNPVAALAELERAYIHQHYATAPGQKRPSPDQVSESFAENLHSFYGGRIDEVLAHPRYRLHVLTSRGRHILNREHRWRTPAGYFGAFLTNTVHRKAMGAWIERVVFSAQGAQLPFATADYKTRQVELTPANFQPALQASCSIPFVLRAVQDIPGAPPGAYWDGGITDYHLHLDYRRVCVGLDAERDEGEGVLTGESVVLYPHFQRQIVPGWLDKSLRWRHGATPFLDNVVVLAPNPEWVKTLPNGKLPDRQDFTHYGNDFDARVKVWSRAVAEAQRLADELQAWLVRPSLTNVGDVLAL